MSAHFNILFQALINNFLGGISSYMSKYFHYDQPFARNSGKSCEPKIAFIYYFQLKIVVIFLHNSVHQSKIVKIAEELYNLFPFKILPSQLDNL